MADKESWVERLPWPIFLIVLLLFILGMVIGAIALIVAYGAAIYALWGPLT